MSLYDYQQSQIIASEGYPFYALIMTAMRQADDQNLVNLKFMFPSIWKELQTRYNAPGGFLPGERELIEAREKKGDDLP